MLCVELRGGVLQVRLEVELHEVAALISLLDAVWDVENDDDYDYDDDNDSCYDDTR